MWGSLCAMTGVESVGLRVLVGRERGLLRPLPWFLPTCPFLPHLPRPPQPCFAPASFRAPVSMGCSLPRQVSVLGPSLISSVSHRDWGSALRHQAPLRPMPVIFLLQETSDRERSEVTLAVAPPHVGIGPLREGDSFSPLVSVHFLGLDLQPFSNFSVCRYGQVSRWAWLWVLLGAPGSAAAWGALDVRERRGAQAGQSCRRS